jgi:integrase
MPTDTSAPAAVATTCSFQPSSGTRPRWASTRARSAVGNTSLTRLAQLGVRTFEQLYAELRVCRRRCKGRTFIEHRTHRAHDCDQRCVPHTCRPLSVSSVRECHAVLSGALNAALRWGWIAVNPLEAVKCPRQQHPQPDPPSAEEAARIVSAAWEQDAEWGTFVWLTFITGARRGELLGLAWEHLGLFSGLLTIRRNLVRQNDKVIIKDTKTHRMRIVSLDPDTVAILTAHKQRVQRRCTELGITLDDDAFVFSYAPDHRRHCDPDGITHRYAKKLAQPPCLAVRGAASLGGYWRNRARRVSTSSSLSSMPARIGSSVGLPAAMSCLRAVVASKTASNSRVR